jgi:hypothetical protein
VKIFGRPIITVECCHCHRKVDLEDCTPLDMGRGWLCSTCTPVWTCKCGKVDHSHTMYRWQSCTSCCDITIDLFQIEFERERRLRKRAERDRDGYRTICYEHGLAS